MTARLALVADIHHGTDTGTKKASAALRLMDDFARFCADAKPDLVIDLGDRISDSDRDTDLRLEQEVAEAFRPIVQPRQHICGNHDRDFLSVADNEAIFSAPMGHRTVDVGAWTLVFFCPDSTLHRPAGFAMTEADLLWLNSVVINASRPLAIFSHAPFSGRDLTGNYWFSNNYGVSLYAGWVERVQAVLARAKVPVTWLSGHVHWNSLTHVDGIPHFTLQSLTETYVTHPEPCGAFALLELGETIRLEVFGRDALTVALPAAQTLNRWVPVLPTDPAFTPYQR